MLSLRGAKRRSKPHEIKEIASLALAMTVLIFDLFRLHSFNESIQIRGFSMANPFDKSLPHADPLWVEHGYGTRFQGFQNLMRIRIRDILLVSSLYDLYVFEEDGRLYELLRSRYQDLNLSHSPELTRVANGKEAISLIREEKRFDLVITTLHIEDMRPAAFARILREEGIHIPVVLLAFDNRELSDLLLYKEADVFDDIFIWQGDFQLLIAIIKSLEDRMNVDHDTHIVGVQSIILIENDVRYYSIFLPMIYIEVMNQSRRLISEGINLSHRQLRQRARPKILFCKTYEEAWGYFMKYQETILGVISDIDFPRNGKPDPEAGLEFTKAVRQLHPDIPVLLHSSLPDSEQKAHQVGASFLWKNSQRLIEELRQFMVEHLSFGDFVYRMPDGREVCRAHDLMSLETSLATVPESSVKYHAERNHFSHWLKARTEFWLAHKLRPRKVTDFPSIAELRDDLISSLRDYRKLRQRGIITAFGKESFDPYSSLSKIGGGVLGGKARGLSFVNILINNYNVQNRFEGVKIYIPPALLIGTGIFDQFLEENKLRDFALNATDNQLIMDRFVKAKVFPEEILGDLAAFLDLVDAPLAVRSSSLLEDSHNHPFAGVYKTYMLPNSHPDPIERLSELVKAIKRVFASTFLQSAKAYIKATSFKLEDEKMAVIVQKMIGSRHGNRFYPTFAGVMRSYNFYPIAPQKYSDGIAAVALGLGKMVVEGGTAIRFCPKYPERVELNLSSKSAMRNFQTDFFALDIGGPTKHDSEIPDYFVKKYPLSAAEEDDTLSYIASTFSPENDAVYDGISRSGTRLVTFAPVLKNQIFPMTDILELLLDMGGWSIGTPVEFEFAVNLSVSPGQPKEFSILQMRPMVLNRELEVLNLEQYKQNRLVCQSDQVLGNGIIQDIYDIIIVNRNRYDRSKSQEVAAEISCFNAKLIAENRKYILIGVGRWGSMDPWLGIPVTWDMISGARTIVEAGFKDFSVMPSQGSHFFQNLNTFLVGYYTVQSSDSRSFIDWDWLLAQPAVEEKGYTKHLRFKRPVVVIMSGHQNKGIIIKPESGRAGT
jgi:CheY-like chemotaxis protein